MSLYINLQIHSCQIKSNPAQLYIAYNRIKQKKKMGHSPVSKSIIIKYSTILNSLIRKS